MSNVASRCKYTIRETTEQDCNALAESMREDDRKEVWHMAHLSPLDSLLRGLSNSTQCFTAEVENLGIVAIFGVVDMGNGVGSPWMLGSVNLHRVRKDFIKVCGGIFDKYFAAYHTLYNYAWAENTTHLRWLKWLGFTLSPPAPLGLNQQPFVYFKKEI